MPLLGVGYMMFMPVSYSLSENIDNNNKEVVTNAEQRHASKNVAKISILHRFWDIMSHIVRFFHLLLIFSPPIFLLPLLFFKKTQEYWMDIFVTSVERAGVVFIKAFQYLSHRRDIIGNELASKFEHLR